MHFVCVCVCADVGLCLCMHVFIGGGGGGGLISILFQVKIVDRSVHVCMRTKPVENELIVSKVACDMLFNCA